ncbi:MAG: LPS assembly lipoprotein LptE [Sulfitobacter sp.]
MSLFNRRIFLILPLALAACGFEPVYGTGGTGTALQNRVLVDAPVDRNAYLATQRIEERIGRGDNAAYTLALKITSSNQGLAIDAAGTTTRYNLVGQADYVLKDTATGQVVTSGKVNNFTGYSATSSTVSALAAERDAQRRLMIILADQIVARLLATAPVT